MCLASPKQNHSLLPPTGVTSSLVMCSLALYGILLCVYHIAILHDIHVCRFKSIVQNLLSPSSDSNHHLTLAAIYSIVLTIVYGVAAYFVMLWKFEYERLMDVRAQKKMYEQNIEHPRKVSGSIYHP